MPSEKEIRKQFDKSEFGKFLKKSRSNDYERIVQEETERLKRKTKRLKPIIFYGHRTK